MRTVPPSRCASARQVIGSAVVLLLLSALLCAQFKGDVLLINVVATVVDGKERTVPNLTIDDFIVEEDGEPQTIKFLAPSADLPISIGVILDTSHSVQSTIRTAQRAIDHFFSVIHPDDEIFLMTFAMGPSLKADFTSDRTTLRNALMAGVNVGGGTALYDSLYQALQKVKRGRHQKKAVLLVTDGEDTRSLTRIDKALQFIREAEMLVYSIGIRGAPGFDMGRNSRSSPRNYTTVDMKVLNQFGEASGGRAWELPEAAFGKKLDAVLDTIAAELRSQYSIGYYPTNPVKDGKWHSVRVRMKNPDYVVRARTGYLAATGLPASTSGIKYAGRPLGDVLRELQATGLNVVFSSEIVQPTMKVLAEPKAVLPREVLDEILREHSLQVRSGPGGTLLVVRLPE
ncbi:MAG TPA: VWA domain-containing protein [Vicinamibacterales bacterium]|nr:VWA domain-containing protein [Vicinamibacterales bacterium]